MGRSVIITTPIPSVEEVARSLGMGKARLRRIRAIVNDSLHEKSGNTRVSTLRESYGDTFLAGWRGNDTLASVRDKTGKSLVELVRDHKTGARKRRTLR